MILFEVVKLMTDIADNHRDLPNICEPGLHRFVIDESTTLDLEHLDHTGVLAQDVSDLIARGDLNVSYYYPNLSVGTNSVFVPYNTSITISMVPFIPLII